MEKKKEKILLKEDVLVEIDAETVLLGLGFIPVIGEVFDIILIVKYFKEKRWIEAFLMMIALIPTVGDAIVKPFLFMGKTLKAFSGTAKFAQTLAKHPKFASMYKKIKPLIGTPAVKKLEAQITKTYPKLAGDIKKAEGFHLNALGKLKPGSAKKMFSKKPKVGLGYGTQQAFRNKMLSKYAKKHGGKIPPEGLSSWYNLVYKARGARKIAFRKMLISSNLLGMLGLPNIEAFEDYITTPEGAEKVMNMTEFQDLYNKTTTPEDEAAFMKQVDSEGGEEGDFLSGLGLGGLSIPMMKNLAAMLI